jgi:hypothetical protein
MQNKKSIIFAFFLTISAVCSQAQGEFVVQINPETGTIIKTGPPIAGITYIYPDDRALNENSGTFFFPSALPTQSLFQIKLADGSTVSSPPYNDLFFFQFDNSTGKLYGIDRDLVTDTKFLVEINPITGIPTVLGPTVLPGTAVYSGAFSTFDETNHRFIFLAPPTILYTLNATDGSIIFQPNLTLGANQSIVSFVYANTANTLFAMIQDMNLQKFYMATIDLETGVSTPFGNGFTVGRGNGSATIDETNGLYYYMYQSDLGYFVASTSLSSGEFLNNAQLPAEDGEDNFFSLKFNHLDQNLYSIHWDAVITSNVWQGNVEENGVKISPHPMIDYAVFQFEKPLLDAQMVIYNEIGQVVKTVETFSGETLEITREGLPGGGYFFQVFEKKGLIFSGNFLIK